jgi:drug/metabolite transporter (DMT)-like permease
MSAFGSAIPSAIVYYSIKHLKPVTASLLLLTDPIWTYILGIFFFNQHLSGWNLLGMTGILLAILLT